MTENYNRGANIIHLKCHSIHCTYRKIFARKRNSIQAPILNIIHTLSTPPFAIGHCTALTGTSPLNLFNKTFGWQFLNNWTVKNKCKVGTQLFNSTAHSCYTSHWVWQLHKKMSNNWNWLSKDQPVESGWIVVTDCQTDWESNKWVSNNWAVDKWDSNLFDSSVVPQFHPNVDQLW